MAKKGFFWRVFLHNVSAASDERGILSRLELQRPSTAVLYFLMFGLLALLTLTMIFPLYWMFSASLKSSVEISQMPPTLFPEQAQWSNFVTAWQHLNYSRYFVNTVLLAAGAVLLQLLVSATAAFSLSKLKPAFQGVLMFFFLTTLMVPSTAYLIPQYLTVVKLPLLGFGILDTWWAVLLPGAVSAFNIFVLKSFFDEIPAELTDAAKIDGANSLTVFLRLVLPLSMSALAVIVIFTVIGSWKDFFWPFLVLSTASNQPIMVALFRLTNQSVGEPMNLVIAGLSIASIPPIILFLIFQKQILKGITLSGIKG
ncbi:MAG: carbohydrate ABC transporter permease [Spirochaetales bacterium]